VPTRIVQVELHAQAADLAGRRRVDLELDDGATTRDVLDRLAALHPSLRDLLGISVLATDSEYLREGTSLDGTGSFHLIPPVSGG
jgi:molybdopterin converting factor small subunit